MLPRSVRVVVLAAALSTGASPVAGQAQQPQTGTPQTGTDASDQFVIINGKTNPELIPEWLAWQFTFDTLAIVDPKTSAFTKDLVLSKSEADVVFGEARLEKTRTQSCVDKQERTKKGAAHLSVEELKALLDDDVLDCRGATLDARDRVLEALSPEGRASIEQFVAETRAGLQSVVPKSDLNLFWRPQ